ncbi:Hypothetical protein NTJ_06211 [Nesidiocoris tenuis]|uniref:Uncharacterized protein n=1 Tax=Nesidiocoris tenuis TaxID=355587 RepID=A0ABN7AMD3_9HEMI|nr:Hypothetical protein NTJ_06211 [Nesidiocoris tenuis]
MSIANALCANQLDPGGIVEYEYHSRCRTIARGGRPSLRRYDARATQAVVAKCVLLTVSHRDTLIVENHLKANKNEQIERYSRNP